MDLLELDKGFIIYNLGEGMHNCLYLLYFLHGRCANFVLSETFAVCHVSLCFIVTLLLFVDLGKLEK